jgi:glycosyltransferase involved in cell wall biosynthesis
MRRTVPRVWLGAERMTMRTPVAVADDGAAGVTATARRPAVMIVSKFPSSAAAKRGVCAELTSRLERRGWTVHTTSAWPGRISRLFDIVRTIWRKRHRYQVAQVDVFSGPAFVWAEAACWTLRRAGQPYILTLHGGNLPAFAARWPRRVQRLLRSAARVTTPSHYLMERMQPYCDGLRVVPNALEIGAYPFRPRTAPKPRLVWLRSFHQIYNPALAARVLHGLLAGFPHCELVMVGPDEGDGSLEAFKQAARELDVSGRIRLPGGVPKETIGEWMNAGDVFLNTTNIDNTPVSVLEAMACGLCVVSTNVGGLPYLLENGRDALLVQPDDPQAMAVAVRRVLTEPGLGERLSRNARVKVEQFSWKVVLPQWEQLLTIAAREQRP